MRFLRRHWQIVLLSLVALLARTWNLTTPLADWHSFRQADTVSVAREYVKHGIDLKRPRYHDLSNIQSGKDNLQGYRMVEWPIVSALVAWLYVHVEPLMSIELHVLYRITSIMFSIGSLLSIYFLLQLITKKRSIALVGAGVFGLLPYSVFYARTTLPENPAVFFALFSALMLLLYVQKVRRYWLLILSAIGAALAVLIKPTALFLLLPHLVIVFEHRAVSVRTLWKWILYALMIMLPLIWWRRWILTYPEGVPASQWLLNGNGIRFSGAFFRWLFAERLAKLILGYWGIHFFLLGLQRSVRYHYIFASVLGGLLYVVVFASGNVQHDYYQVLLLPAISMIVGIGIVQLWMRKAIVPKVLAILVIALSLAFSWYEVRGYYQINNWDIVRAGAAVDALVPKDALVIAPYFGDTAFLYQTNRRGWPIGFSIEEKIAMGASYYVSTSYDDEARALEDAYTLVEKNDGYILIKLD